MKNKMKTPLFRVIPIVLSLVLLLSPFAVLLGTFFGTKSVYKNTFYGELDDKYDALYAAEGEKIVIVGGSSVAFGYDSRTLSDLFARPVINFGLYAELGTKLMLDLSEDAIHEGDIVLLAPELDAQTLSLYFNGAATLRALDEKPSMLRRIRFGNLSSLWGSLWSVTGEKYRYLKNGAPDPDSVYNSRNFNAAGDLVYEREANVMDGYFDSTTPIIPDGRIVSSDFLDYLNAYIDRIEKRGATVYYAFCPINAMALTEKNGNGEEIPAALAALTIDYDETKGMITGVSLSDTLSARCERFESFLSQNLHCPVLGHMTDFVYPPNYFYDTNFHLNETGVEWHTRGIGNLLYQSENATDETPLSRMGRLPTLYIPLADMESVYDVGDLRYQMTYSETFAVVGVSERGMEKETIVLPPSITVYDRNLEREIACPVASISTAAFAGTTRLKTVVVGDKSRMKAIRSRAFADSSVSEIYLFCPVNGFLAGKDMLVGAQSGFKILVGQNLGYEADYSWSGINVEGRPKTLEPTDKTPESFAE